MERTMTLRVCWLFDFFTEIEISGAYSEMLHAGQKPTPAVPHVNQRQPCISGTARLGGDMSLAKCETFLYL
jgi:hypothetical protein